MSEEDPSRRDGPSEDTKFYVTGMRYLTVGFEFVGLLFVFGYIGTKVEAKYDCEPWGLLGGLVAGMTAGLYAMVKQLEKINR